MEPEPLIFPEGVRFLCDDEWPPGHEVDRERTARARITTGYVRQDRKGEVFDAFFEANVHAPRVWEAFCALVEALLPEVAAPIVGVNGEDPIFGPYTSRAAALGVLEPHARRLQHDGMLEFGLIFRTDEVMEEVFVPSVKYLQVWTNRPDRAESVFAQLGLPAMPHLQFIDDHPRVVLHFRTPEGRAGWLDVIEQLREAFGALPRAERPPADV